MAVRSQPSLYRAVEVFLVFLKLGCSAFGGPIAHLGYFQAEFVEKRRWLGLDTFTEIVALAQSLPGPASSQVGYSVGLLRAGLPGGFAAWLGFTLPSALLMLAFAFGHSLFAGRMGSGFLHGLQLAAVAVVAQAVLTMQRNLAPDRARFAIALSAVVVVLLVPSTSATLFAILLGAGAGLLLEKPLEPAALTADLPSAISKRTGMLSLSLSSVSFSQAASCSPPVLSPQELSSAASFGLVLSFSVEDMSYCRCSTALQ